MAWWHGSIIHLGPSCGTRFPLVCCYRKRLESPGFETEPQASHHRPSRSVRPRSSGSTSIVPNSSSLCDPFYLYAVTDQFPSLLYPWIVWSVVGALRSSLPCLQHLHPPGAWLLILRRYLHSGASSLVPRRKVAGFQRLWQPFVAVEG